jgi:hypothetical protein
LSKIDRLIIKYYKGPLWLDYLNMKTISESETQSETYNDRDIFIIYKTKYKSSKMKKQESLRTKKRNSRRVTRDDIISAYSIAALNQRFKEKEDPLFHYLSLTRNQSILKSKLKDNERTCKEFWKCNPELEDKILESKKNSRGLSYLFIDEIKKNMLAFLRKKRSTFMEMSNLQFNFQPDLDQANNFTSEKRISNEYNNISFSFCPKDYELIEEISKELKYCSPTLNHETAGVFLIRKAMRNENCNSWC